MSRLKFEPMLFLLAMLGGCTLRIGPLDESTGPSDSPMLPVPDEGSGTDPPLSAAQQARQDEVDHYIAEVVYQGATVLYSFILPSGDQLDFIDRNMLQSLPYPLPQLPIFEILSTMIPGGCLLNHRTFCRCLPLNPNAITVRL